MTADARVGAVDSVSTDAALCVFRRSLLRDHGQDAADELLGDVVSEHRRAVDHANAFELQLVGLHVFEALKHVLTDDALVSGTQRQRLFHVEGR